MRKRAFLLVFVSLSSIRVYAGEIKPEDAVRISAQMLSSVIGIAADPHNPQHVAASVQNLILNFAQLIEQAVKQLQIEDPHFLEADNCAELISARVKSNLLAE